MRHGLFVAGLLRCGRLTLLDDRLLLKLMYRLIMQLFTLEPFLLGSFKLSLCLFKIHSLFGFLHKAVSIEAVKLFVVFR